MNPTARIMLYLKKANMPDAAGEYEMFRTMPADENGLTNPDAGVSFDEFRARVLPALIAHAEGEGLPAGYVPYTTYFLWDGDEAVGIFRLRHYLNDFLRAYHGHVGYGIRPDRRGEGLAARGLALLIREARGVIREDALYLSVHRDNPASLRAQKKNGAVIVREDEVNFYTRIALMGTDR